MQITEKRNFMDIFYIIVLAIHYPYRARGKYFMFLVFLDIVYDIYIVKIVYIGGKRQNKDAG